MENVVLEVVSNCVLIFLWTCMSYIVCLILLKIVDLAKSFMSARWHL